MGNILLSLPYMAMEFRRNITYRALTFTFDLHASSEEKHRILGCDAIYPGILLSAFRRNILSQSPTLLP
jgi:hypothetical protein